MESRSCKMNIRPKLLVSVSGGRTSTFMAKKLKDDYSDQYEMIFVFSNTGEEWEETLVFMDRCDREFGLGCVWVESVVHAGREGTTHKIVNFETASRKGEPFEQVIRKYGIPNKAFPHCSRELKFRPITSYAKSIGWKNYLTAIGIRADEPRRIRDDKNLIYPLFNMFPTDKPTIIDWWSQQRFDLQLKEHQGNCKWCWKKSLKKHILIAKESPEAFAFPLRMEAEHGRTGAGSAEGAPRTFFREFRSAKDIIQISEFLNPSMPAKFDPEEDSGCSESCEAFE